MRTFHKSFFRHTVTAVTTPVTILLTILFAAGAQAQTTRHVAADGSGEYTTIQAAITAANPGDTLLVAAGVYRESIEWPSKDLVIEGAGAGWSVLDVSGASGSRCVHAVGQSSASRFQGFTCQGGSNYGGGILTEGSSLIIANCVLSGNSAGAGYLGGGMYLSGGSPAVVNCVFSNNTSGYWGGGLFIEDGTAATLVNCTFSGNTAYDGGAIFNYATTTTLANCIIWGNSADYDPGMENYYYNSPSISNCDIQGLPNSLPDSNGNFAGDPLFVDAVHGDFHLAPGSPCIDTGNNTSIVSPPFPTDGDNVIIDLDGSPRILGGVVNMGAYEARPPIANAGQDSTYTILHDGDPTTNTVSFTLQGSGSDPEGGSLSYEWRDASGVVGTTPTLNVSRSAGTYQFILSVTDSAGLHQSDAVVITVAPEPNAAPLAGGMSIDLDRDTSKSITLNTFDADGDNVINLVSRPLHGDLAIGPGGSLVYTPNAGYYGPDSFAFFAVDPYGAVSNTATCSLTVNHVNHAPVAKSQSVSTAEDTAKGITLSATDADGDSLTYSITSGPSHGTLSGTAPNLTYTPAANYNGPDSFTFKADDGHGGTSTATVSLTVTPVNDNPVAQNDSATTRKATAVTINVLANDSDVDGDALTVSSVTQPANGTVVKNANNSLTFTPAKSFTGTTTFAYTIIDGHGGSASATVTVTVTK